MTKIKTVTIISIWSKAPEIGRPENFTYSVIAAGETDKGILEQAFCRTNQDDRPNGRRCCSTSAGDVMILDGQHYLVEGIGMRPISLVQSQAIQKLTSRDTSFGLDFLIEHCNVPAE